MSIHRTIDELAREAAAVTREVAERRAVPPADLDGFAAQLRPRRTLRVAAVVAAICLAVVAAGTLANELRDGPSVPVISDADDRQDVEDDGQVLEDVAPPPAVVRNGGWEWDWALSRVTDPDVFAGPGPARVSGIAIPTERVVVAVGVSPSLSSSGQLRPGVWVSRDAGASWSAVDPEAIGLPDGSAPDASVVMHDVAAAGARLVAVGDEAGNAGERGVVWVSDDGGDTWQVVHRTGEGAPGRLVAVTTTWIRVPEPGGSSSQAAGFVAVGSHAPEAGARSTAAVWTSPDGEDWSQPQLLPDAPPGVTPSSIAADKWSRSIVVVGVRDPDAGRARDGETRAWVSVDHGASWRAEPIADDVDLTAVAHMGSPGWLAVGATRASASGGEDRDGVVYTSGDGADWEPAADPLGELAGPGAQVLHAATYGEGFDPYVVVGVDDGRPAIWVSPDLDIWRRLPSEELFPAGTPTGITAVGYWGRIIAIGELARAGATELAVWRSVSKESVEGSTGAVVAELADAPPPIELAHDAIWTSPPEVPERRPPASSPLPRSAGTIRRYPRGTTHPGRSRRSRWRGRRAARCVSASARAATTASRGRSSGSVTGRSPREAACSRWGHPRRSAPLRPTSSCDPAAGPGTCCSAGTERCRGTSTSSGAGCQPEECARSSSSTATKQAPSSEPRAATGRGEVPTPTPAITAQS
jgi:hypothetical protein